MKTKQLRKTIIPIEIVNQIKSLNLSKIQENKCFHLVSLIRSKSRKEYNNYFSFVELPSNYLKKIFSEKYKETINYLLDLNIIISDNYYTFNNTKLNKSLSYKINDLYINFNRLSLIAYNSVLFSSKPLYTRDSAYFVNDIKTLKIDTNKLIEITNNRINNLSIYNFKTDNFEDDIVEVVFKTFNYENRYITSISKAIETAKKHNLTLIQDKRKFWIMNPNDFISMKKEYIMSSYMESIKKIEDKHWYAARNLTNNRLDSNITNMCGELINEIIKDNNLVELDLANSQFSILAHQASEQFESDDLSLFKQLTYSGGLYTYIQTVLGLETRREAKQVTFELLFSSHKNKSVKLKKLKEHFPNVIDWINNYKKENGSNQFAIMLQKKESEMFIDHIWYYLKKQKIFALTKHDCIICKKEDMYKVKSFIELYFDSIGFEGKLNIK